MTVSQASRIYLQQQMAMAGMEQQYISAIADTEKFAPLFRFLVTRIDKVTGEKKEFPIQRAAYFNHPLLF